ncbi:MAG: HmuY family protein [Dehalococcoidia bacterium]
MSSLSGDATAEPDGPVSRKRRRWPWLVAVLVVVPIIVVGAWVVWSLVRPNPEGFAPSARASDPNAAVSIGSTAPAGQAPEATATLQSGPVLLQFTADARSRQEWVFFSFQSGTTVETTRDALDWDIAFRRNDILTNGGETNPAGQGGAIDLGEVEFAEAVVPTGSAFATDTEHEERGLENPELHAWYNYNWTTHIVSSKEHTYAVKGASGDLYLLTFVSYYCDDRSPACVTFQYQGVSLE